VRHSDETETMSSLQTLRNAFWSQLAYDDLRRIIRAEAPDVMHCTNTFPLISPAAYDAAHDEGVPVVQSLHNFRLMCANGLFLREGAACEDCLGKTFPWPAMVHGCYRHSRLASTAMAGLITRQRLRRKRNDPVSLYVALSEFSRQKFLETGFPEDKVVVKPNFVDPDPGPGSGGGGYAVFVGRLSEEKGLDVLIDAWSGKPELPPLKIIGDGPLAPRVLQAETEDSNIAWLGRLSTEQVYELIGRATCLILPSRCYENCPKTILEAHSRGTPVIASRLGAMREYVDDGATGLLFQPGDAEELAHTVQSFAGSPDQQWLMRRIARQVYEERYTADVHFRLLMQIYACAARRPSVKWPSAPADNVSHDRAIPESGDADPSASFGASGESALT